MATNFDGTQSGENFNFLGVLTALAQDAQEFGTDTTGRGANTQQSLEFGLLLPSYLPAEIHPRNLS